MPDASPTDSASSLDLLETREPPRTILGIVRQLGPGLIIAGSIVGSGELIATTTVGAEAGFTLMWLIIIGCVIKVFAQVEFGRYTIVNGRTTMDGLNEVPGPRLNVNWIVWYWLIMFLMSLAQLGGIVGGVGQALTISRPLTRSGRQFNEYQDLQIKLVVHEGLLARVAADGSDAERVTEVTQQRDDLLAQLARIEEPYVAAEEYQIVKSELDNVRQALAAEPASADAVSLRERETELSGQAEALRGPARSNDELIWAAIITGFTIVILVIGRYQLIQTFATVLVAGFTFITIGNLFHLQSLPDWRVTWDELVHGMSFHLPSNQDGLATALMAFGIIGVGATELIQYPYWCLEKGYARWTGPRDNSDEWASRATGWLRVMRWDAWASMIVYTFATVAFYLLGAAVLGRTGLNPAGSQMVRTLAEMYVPVFGASAQYIFLFGAFSVLYSTFFVANASHARVCADAVRIFGLSEGGAKANRFWTVVFCVVFPVTCLVVYSFVRAAKALVLASGAMQAIMLPMLGAAALFFRYRRCDDRIRPGTVWDICLWISGAGLLLAGSNTLLNVISQLWQTSG